MQQAKQLIKTLAYQLDTAWHDARALYAQDAERQLRIPTLSVGTSKFGRCGGTRKGPPPQRRDQIRSRPPSAV